MWYLPPCNYNIQIMGKINFKIVFAWVVGILFITAGIYIFWFAFSGSMNDEFFDLYKDHFSAIVGLPAAAFISTFLILLLKVSEKEPLEFTLLSMSFKGVSGEIVLWVFVYLSVAGSIKILW